MPLSQAQTKVRKISGVIRTHGRVFNRDEINMISLQLQEIP